MAEREKSIRQRKEKRNLSGGFSKYLQSVSNGDEKRVRTGTQRERSKRFDFFEKRA